MILVTGSTGQVGQSVIQELKKASVAYCSPTRGELDLDNDQTIFDYLQRHKIKTIIHLAAETNVDFCESNREIALSRNYYATKTFIKYCQFSEARMVFMSSSAVLSGDGKFTHSENAGYSPANFYGETKMKSELEIVGSEIPCLIIRASWMLGKGLRNKKFAQVIHQKIVNQESIKAVYDRFGSLTSAERLGHLIVTNLHNIEADLIHCASRTPCSRYEIAKHIKQFLGAKSEVEPVSNDEFNLAAPRGFSEGLLSDLAISKYGYLALTWEDELDHFLRRI